MNKTSNLKLISENLDRKFKALLEIKDENDFIFLAIDYVGYLGDQKELSGIFNELLKENKLLKKSLEVMFFYWIFFKTITKQEYENKISFFTKEINKKFQLKKTLIKELEKVKAEDRHRSNKNLPLFNPNTDKIKTRSKDLFYLQKIHNDLMEKISFEINNYKPKKVQLIKNGYLLFQNKKILISKNKDSNQYLLLRTVFKNKNKLWNYDEIWEDWYSHEGYDPKQWTKFYNASYKINQKIAQETMIKDFLDFDSKTVRIDEKYLS